jgi:predicted peptidase
MLMLVLAGFGCGGDGNDCCPDPDPGPRTIQDIRDDFNELNIVVGTNDLELESNIRGVFWNFRLIVPEGATSANKLPLVLRLHGAAQANSPMAHQSTSCLVEPAFEGKDVFILSPNSNGDLWYEEKNIFQVTALLDLTMTNLDIDQDKVVVTGYSDGGNGSWFYSRYFPDIFSAGIPMATSYDTASSDGSIPKIDVPLYVIHGELDDLFPVDITRGYVEESIDAGSDITFVVADGLVHNEPCTYVDELKSAVDWLYTDIW